MTCVHNFLGESSCEHCGASESATLRAQLTDVTRARDSALAQAAEQSEARHEVAVTLGRREQEQRERAERAEAMMGNRGEIVLCCDRGDLHLVDVSGVRRIYMHPDDVETLYNGVPILLISSTAPLTLYAATGICIIKNDMMPRGVMAFDPPARRLEGK